MNRIFPFCEIILRKILFFERICTFFKSRDRDYKVVDKEWTEVRDQLVNMRVNGGFPYITVNDGDYMKNGELYLKHWYEGMELDLKYLEKVLPYVHRLWGRTVHIESSVENRKMMFSYDGRNMQRKFL